ncbi:MAG: glycosyltransferase family 2 protein [Candidatus Dormibacterales bacterium]
MTEGAGNPRVVVIVLNWNLPHDTMRCLHTTIPLVQAGAAVVVVDNGSIHERWIELDEAVHKSFPDCVSVTDAQASATRVERGRIGLVRLASNLGYAGGNNVGMRIALNSGADWVILLNNDCEVPSDLVDGLTNGAPDMARVGAVGCQLLTFDEPSRILYGGGKRLYAFGVHTLTKWRKPSGWWRVNFVPFACVALSSQALRKLGLLDERYFAYVEDCEYSYRLAEDGWTMAVNLDVRVKHRVSASLGRRSPRYYYYVARNTPLFILERLKTPVQLLSIACFVAQCVALVARLSISGRLEEARAVLAGWKDYLLRRTGAMRSWD